MHVCGRGASHARVCAKKKVISAWLTRPCTARCDTHTHTMGHSSTMDMARKYLASLSVHNCALVDLERRGCVMDKDGDLRHFSRWNFCRSDESD